MKKQNRKKSQAGIIVTVLLILVAIAAVVIVAKMILDASKQEDSYQDVQMFFENAVYLEDKHALYFVLSRAGSNNVPISKVQIAMAGDDSLYYLDGQELPSINEKIGYTFCGINSKPEYVELLLLYNLPSGKEKLFGVLDKTSDLRMSTDLDMSASKCINSVPGGEDLPPSPGSPQGSPLGGSPVNPCTCP